METSNKNEACTPPSRPPPRFGPQVTKMFVPILWRSGYTLINRLRPRYKLMISDPIAQDLADLAELVTAGRLNPVLDPASPFPFTADGVKAAFKLQASKHAHGKVVVTVS